MPKAVVVNVDQDEMETVRVIFDVFRNTGERWQQVAIKLSLDEYSDNEVERRIKVVLTKLKQLEAAKANPLTKPKEQMKADWIGKEVVV